MINVARELTFKFCYQAEDSGNPVRYDTASVSIYIEDVNDCPPLFLHSPYVANVVENAADVPR